MTSASVCLSVCHTLHTESKLHWMSNRMSYVLYRMAPLTVTLLDLEGRFSYSNSSRSNISFSDMSASSARPVSTGYVNFSDLGVHLTQNLRPHSYIRSSCRALTTTTQSWRARRKRRLTNCNEVLNAAARVYIALSGATAQ